MNTNPLTRRYKELTARERLQLIIAASARGDDVEREKLLGSAPTICLRAGHHYHLAEALFRAAHCHVAFLSDLAAKYWQWWGLWGWHCLRDETEKGNGGAGRKRGAARTAETRLCNLTRYHAFLFVTHVDGWKKFCDELLIDAEVLLDDMPGWEMAKRTEGKAREDALSRDDALMFLLAEAIKTQRPEAERLDDPTVPTAEELAQEWHKILERRAGDGPGNASS